MLISFGNTTTDKYTVLNTDHVMSLQAEPAKFSLSEDDRTYLTVHVLYRGGEREEIIMVKEDYYLIASTIAPHNQQTQPKATFS